jgi:hypothetical protein
MEWFRGPLLFTGAAILQKAAGHRKARARGGYSLRLWATASIWSR